MGGFINTTQVYSNSKCDGLVFRLCSFFFPLRWMLLRRSYKRKFLRMSLNPLYKTQIGYFCLVFCQERLLVFDLVGASDCDVALSSGGLAEDLLASERKNHFYFFLLYKVWTPLPIIYSNFPSHYDNFFLF